jgi:hypothetical protein
MAVEPAPRTRMDATSEFMMVGDKGFTHAVLACGVHP